MIGTHPERTSSQICFAMAGVLFWALAASFSLQAQSRADLAFAKGCGSLVNPAGQPFNCNAVVVNLGPDTARDVYFVDYLPANTYPSSLPPTCTMGPLNILTCPLGDLENGQRADIQFQATTSRRGGLSNTGIVVSRTLDPVPGNNSDQAIFSFQPVSQSPTQGANLGVTSSILPSPFNVWNPLSYQTTVTNQGPATARAVQLINPLVSFGSTFRVTGISSSSTTATCNLYNGRAPFFILPTPTRQLDRANVVCLIGDLPAGNSVRFNFTIEPTQPNQTILNGTGVFSATSDFSLTNNQSFGTVPLCRILGDVNNDGKVDLEDVNIARSFVGQTVSENPDSATADIDASGIVNDRDVALVEDNFTFPLGQTEATVPFVSSDNVAYSYFSPTQAYRYISGGATNQDLIMAFGQFTNLLNAPLNAPRTNLGASHTERYTNVQNNDPNVLYGFGGSGTCEGALFRIRDAQRIIVAFTAVHLAATDHPEDTLNAAGPFPPGTEVVFFGADDSYRAGRGTRAGILAWANANKANLNILGYFPGDTVRGDIQGNFYTNDRRTLTFTALGSSLNPSTDGQSVTLSANVTTSGGTVPPGAVTFFSGSTPIGTATLDSSGQATITTSALTVGSHSITAVFPGDGNFAGSTSDVLIQTVNAATNPVPTLFGLSPNSATVGGAAFTLNVSGSGFVPDSVVRWDGLDLSTSYVSNLLLNASVSASGLASAGTASITVFNPTPGGGTSNALTFSINNPVPNLASLSPNATIAGSPDFTLTVNGSNFGTFSGVFWNGTSRTTSFITENQLIANIPAADVATPGTAEITVVNSSPGGGTSNPLTFTINRAATTTSLTSSPNPSTFGQGITLTSSTGSLSVGTPTGSVTFRNRANVLGTGTLNGSGQADLTISNLTAGSYSFTAEYLGNINFAGSSSAALTQMVNQANTTTSLTSSPNPSGFGQGITLTSSTGSLGVGTPTGSVTFRNGMNVLGTGTLDSSGQAGLAISNLTAGSYSFTAEYLGEINFSSSTSLAVNQIVNPATTSTSLTSSLNPSVFGQSVIYSVNVNSGGGTPIGTVTFRDETTVLGTATLNGGGQASFTTSMLTGGNHAITVEYLGDGNFSGSTSPVLNQTVNQASTSTLLISSANPSSFGQSVVLTATVTSVGGTPTQGSVTFRDGANIIGTATLNSGGQASLTTSTLTAGSHSITAEYGGDSNFAGSTSPPLIQTVNPAVSSTTTSLSSSLNPSTFGQPVTFTSTVSGSGGTPTGILSFLDLTSVLGSAPLDGNGQASLTVSNLGAASHSITATYGGDSSFTGSTSAVLNQTVNQASTSSLLMSSVNPSNIGQSVVLTAIVTSDGGTPAGGGVTFLDGATIIGTETLNSGGQASIVTSSLTAGSHNLTVVYGGNSNFVGSTSPVLMQTVNKTDPFIGIGAGGPSSFGQSVTFTGTVIGGSSMPTPTGTVTFFDGANVIGTGTLDGNGQASLTLSTLGVGSHLITMSYGGDANFNAGTVGLTQIVNKADTAISLASSPNPSNFNQVVIFTATMTSTGGTPTGALTIFDGGTVSGTAPLSISGQASFTRSNLTVGTHDITVTYSTNASFNGSTSNVVTQIVNP